MYRRLPFLTAGLLALASSTALANNDNNTSFRAGTISPPSIDGTSPSDAATASADQGRAGYQVPIVAPPGKKGVEPNLGLVYAGRGDGIAGAGWALSIPEIRVKTSGRGGQPTWTGDEVFVGLGGEDLILLDAQTVPDVDGDGIDEAVYREERDLQFLRYVKRSGGGWRIDYPDGRSLTLGSTSDARIERASDGRVSRWLPETLEDATGNQLSYTWATASSALPGAISATARYLTSIEWAGGNQEMRFAYATRGGTTAGTARDFSAGFLEETEGYLTSITTASEGSDVRTYTLGYDTSKTRLLLTSVTVSTADGALPATRFTYTTSSPQASQPEALAGVPGVLFKPGVQMMDLDDDGRNDVVDLSSALTPKVYGNQGNGVATFATTGTTISQPPGALPTTAGVSLEDKHHVLRMDVVDLMAAKVYPNLGASGWGASETMTSMPAVAFGTDTVRADVDQDGYPDLIDTSGATVWKIYFDDGTGNFADTVTCTNTSPLVGTVLHARNAGVLFGDTNGDGLVDVSYVDAAGNAYLFPGRGRGCWGYLSEDGHGVNAYDLLHVTAGNGLPVPANLRLADLDGDSLADLVEIGSPSRVAAWMFQPGVGWNPTSPASWVQSNSATSGCRVADADADGISEVVCSTGWKMFDFADQIPDLLATADNGRGSVTTFTYTTSARVAETHRAAGAPWATNVAAAIPVVASLVEDDGRGHTLERSFDYRDAFYVSDELDARYEFVGFAYIAEKQTPKLAGVADPSDPGALVRRFYDVGSSDWYRHGLETCEETWPATAAPGSFACQGATGALDTKVWSYAVTIDPTDGFATVQRTSQDDFVAEGGATSTQLRTEWAYDGYGNVTTQIAYGRYRATNRLYGSDEHATVTDYALDTTGWNLRLPSRVRDGKITAAGAFTQMSMDQFLYDGATSWQNQTIGAGLLTKTKGWFADPVAGTNATLTTSTLDYTAQGMVDHATDALGVVTDHDYDALTGLFEVRREVDPGKLALVETIAIDTRNGQETQHVAPDGAVTQAGYDALGRLTWLARPGASEAAPTLARSYVDAAPLSTVTETAIDGHAVVTSVDGDGRVVCTASAAGGGEYDITQRDFTARGAVALEIAPYRAAACDALVARSTTHDHDTTVIDAAQRPLSVVHADGTTHGWSYGILTTTESDEEDNAVGSAHHATPTVRHVDGLGRVIAIDETHVALDDDPGTHTTSFTWDALGKATRVNDGNGTAIYSATYDSRSRKVRDVDADLGQTTTSYDAVGQALRVTDARGIATDLTWDHAGRVKSTTSPSGASSYHYDTAKIPAATGVCHTTGRLAWVTDPSGSEVFCYDDHGNPTNSAKIVAAHGASPLVTTMGYDDLDRPTTRVAPDGNEIAWAYGDDGRISTVTATIAGVATTLASVSYEPDGQLAAAELGNGVTLGREYDARRRPVHLTAIGAASTWQDLVLGYDGVGDLTDVADAIGSDSAQYTYDDLYRLASATGDRYGVDTATYRYDRRGNLTRKELTDMTSPAHIGALTYGDPVKVHAVTLADGIAYHYDAAGHLTDDGARRFQWTDSGYLGEVDDFATGALVYEVTYDRADTRVWKQSASGDTVVYVPAAAAELRTEGGVATWIDRVDLLGMPLARIAGGAITYPIPDQLGSPTVVLDASGAEVERTSTYPFGEENPGTLASYLDPTDPASTLEHRFQGRELDAETGDYDFGARMYRPELGRFLSPDTVVPDASSSQAWNRYSFVLDNPLRFVDPSGHDPIKFTETEVQDQLSALEEASGTKIDPKVKPVLAATMSAYDGQTIDYDGKMGNGVTSQSVQVGASAKADLFGFSFGSEGTVKASMTDGSLKHVRLTFSQQDDLGSHTLEEDFSWGVRWTATTGSASGKMSGGVASLGGDTTDERIGDVHSAWVFTRREVGTTTIGDTKYVTTRTGTVDAKGHTTWDPEMSWSVSTVPDPTTEPRSTAGCQFSGMCHGTVPGSQY
jgi:RHS repeat-associated protein